MHCLRSENTASMDDCARVLNGAAVHPEGPQGGKRTIKADRVR